MEKEFSEKFAKFARVQRLGFELDKHIFYPGEKNLSVEKAEKSLDKFYKKHHKLINTHIETPETAEKRRKKALEHFKNFLNSPEEDSITMEKTKHVLRLIVDARAKELIHEAMDEKLSKKKRIFKSTKETLEHINTKEKAIQTKKKLEILDKLEDQPNSKQAFKILNNLMDDLTPQTRKKIKKFLEEAEIKGHGKHFA